MRVLTLGDRISTNQEERNNTESFPAELEMQKLKTEHQKEVEELREQIDSLKESHAMELQQLLNQ